MDYLYLGKIVNTHGIKGEIRILSDFKYKEQVFKKGNNIYIGRDKIKEVLNSYRVHKNYDMVTLEGINDINDVLKYKGMNVYIDRNEYKFEGIIYEDLIGMKVLSDSKEIGVIEEVLNSSAHPIIKLDNGAMIPFIDEFILNVDLDKKEVKVKLIDGLM